MGATVRYLGWGLLAAVGWVLELTDRPGGRFSDQEVASRSFYIWQSERDITRGHRQPLKVGQRLSYPEDARYETRWGITFEKAPDGIALFWPGRLFRVGDVEGMLRRSFTPTYTVGWCRAFTILEELPATLAFGPRGADAVAIHDRALRLSAEDVVRLGEIARATHVAGSDGHRRERVRHMVETLAPPPRASPPRSTRMFEMNVDLALTSLALRVDHEIGPGHLLDEFDGCDPYLALIDPVWGAAHAAINDALMAALWSDLLDPESETWLAGPWRAFVSGAESRE